MEGFSRGRKSGISLENQTEINVHVYRFDLLVESDSMYAISLVNKKDDRPWKLWRFFNELDLLVNHIERVEFVHIFREANSTADFFDKKGVAAAHVFVAWI
uniref:RNase H type-1 domain-containing protein n=1 Tax=Gossypium raimondii TaxID=29730 RepID=A0A0D2QTR4_GOSRA|nr:hypothetical protein B456_001G210500 [Gossypium raimondii]